MDPDLLANQALQRAHHRDGLPEISIGVAFLVFAALNLAGSKAASVALSILIPAVCLGTPWVLRQVRRRWLVERFGYVEYRPMNRRRIGRGLLVGALVCCALFGLDPGPGWVLAGTGLSSGALLAWCGRLPRFVAGGAVIAAMGVALAFSGASLPEGFAILFGAQGSLALVSGAMAFRQFVR